MVNIVEIFFLPEVFCLGLGWYDGHSYYLFSNKYLKKHKPINTYSSGFSLWKPQNFWRKRRIAISIHLYNHHALCILFIMYFTAPITNSKITRNTN
jgi:hypothetical protein